MTAFLFDFMHRTTIQASSIFPLAMLAPQLVEMCDPRMHIWVALTITMLILDCMKFVVSE